MPFKIIHKFDNLIIADVINRPSKQIKSPYLADIRLPKSKNTELAHSPGLGLCGFITTNSIIAINKINGNTKRKSNFTIELVLITNDENKDVWVGANPSTSNLYFRNIIEKNLLSFLPKINLIKQEVKLPELKSRFDFLLESKSKKYIVEVKNVPLVDYPNDKMPSFRKFPIRKGDKRFAIFPDGYQGKKDLCVSPRALKHLKELILIKKKYPEYTPMLIFVIQREDCYGFTPNFEKDPIYSNALKQAYDEGLIIKALMLKLSPKNIKFIKEVPITF